MQPIAKTIALIVTASALSATSSYHVPDGDDQVILRIVSFGGIAVLCVLFTALSQRWYMITALPISIGLGMEARVIRTRYLRYADYSLWSDGDAILGDLIFITLAMLAVVGPAMVIGVSIGLKCGHH